MKSCVIMGTGSLNMSYKTSSRPFCREDETKSAARTSESAERRRCSPASLQRRQKQQRRNVTHPDLRVGNAKQAN